MESLVCQSMYRLSPLRDRVPDGDADHPIDGTDAGFTVRQRGSKVGGDPVHDGWVRPTPRGRSPRVRARRRRALGVLRSWVPHAARSASRLLSRFHTRRSSACVPQPSHSRRRQIAALLARYRRRSAQDGLVDRHGAPCGLVPPELLDGTPSPGRAQRGGPRRIGDERVDRRRQRGLEPARVGFVVVDE